MTEKIYETTNEYFRHVIRNSRTWHSLTEEEKQKFANLDIFDEIKGIKDIRERWLFTVYVGFLASLGYDGARWREIEEDKEESFF